MTRAIKDFSISYDAINEHNTFSAGDPITGRLILDLFKETKIKNISVKITGDANVHWTERNGERDESYYSHRRFFKLKQYIQLQEKTSDITKISPGSHVYPFSFQIPQGDFPSSFKGEHGKIEYLLQAKLCRSWRLPSHTNRELAFFSRPIMYTIQPMLMNEKIQSLSTNNLSMVVNIEKLSFHPGEVLKIWSEIKHSSSRELRPKFKLERKHIFIATTSSNVVTKIIFKEVGNPISPQQKIYTELRIPVDLSASILNCEIIKVEYTLKVYVDVPLARDPTIKFPMLILPAVSQFGQCPEASIGFVPFGNPGMVEPGSQPIPFGNPGMSEPASQPFPFGNPGMVEPGNQAFPTPFGPCPPASAPGACYPPTAPGLYPPPYMPDTSTQPPPVASCPPSADQELPPSYSSLFH